MTATAARQRTRRHSNRVQHRQTAQWREAREISGDAPPVLNRERRNAALGSLRLWLETYFRGTFHKPWSDDHLQVINRIEAALRNGLQICLAMPRATGKTSIVEAAALWAVVKGLRRYVLVIGAAEQQASDILESILKECRENELLLEDFPEVFFPFVAVGRQQQKRPLWAGQDIELKVQNGTITFANVPGSRAAGATIRTVGIDGNIRGKKAKVAGGNVRPDCVLLDDPQTDESAASEQMTRRRMKRIKGTVLGLAGPGKALTLIACVTVIEPGDLADQMLDHKANPQFRGMRFRMMDAWPESELWEEYFRLRAEEMIAGIDAPPDSAIETPRANAFYAANQTEMDAGGTPRWLHRFNPEKGEISAIQHAMNLIQDLGRAQVEAEYQNQPQPEQTDDLNLKAGAIRSRVTSIPRRTVPRTATRLTAFVDCHDRLLYWVVLAVDERFSAWVIDYGTYPEQRIREFQLRDARQTIAKKHKDLNTPEELHYAAVQSTLDALLEASFHREDGASLQIEKLMIDANWGPMTRTTYLAIGQHRHKARVLPSHGRGYTENETPISGWKKRATWQHGEEWVISPNPDHRALRIIFDTNHWKTRTAKALKSAPGKPGSLMLWGDNPQEHQLFAEHCTAEIAEERTSPKRRIHRWDNKWHRDNHWWDCLVGAIVAASSLGVKVVQDTPRPKRRTREASYVNI